MLNHEDEHEIQKPITFLELESNIKELNDSKAEGNDEITNAMLKNLPDNAKLILMEIYKISFSQGVFQRIGRLGTGEVILE